MEALKMINDNLPLISFNAKKWGKVTRVCVNAFCLNNSLTTFRVSFNVDFWMCLPDLQNTPNEESNCFI